MSFNPVTFSMDNAKPVTAEEIAKMKKNGKTMLAASAGIFVLVVILTIAGGAPTWMIILVGMSLALGAMELRKAKKAEEAMKKGGAAVPPDRKSVV